MKSPTVIWSFALCAALALAAFFYADSKANLKLWKHTEEDLKAKAAELTALRATLSSSPPAASNTLEQPRSQRVQMVNVVSNTVQPMIANHAEPAGQLPITATKRYALPAGNVIQLRNNSPNPIAVRVELANDSLRQSKTFDLVINGEATQEIGKLQGWIGATGDKMRVSGVGYEPLLKQF